MANNRTVLIVDDDTTLCDMYTEELTAKGYEVKKAHNGVSGLSSAIKEQPDIILLDIMMPKMNGFNTLKKLKANAKTSKIPVIMLSALIQEENKKQALSLGAARYLSKSEVKPMDVVQVVASLLK